MASQPILDDEMNETGQEVENSPLHIRDIIAAESVTDLLDDTQLANIGQRCLTDLEIDENSRKDWLVSYRKWLDTAMQVAKSKTTPWPGAANVIVPILTTASIQFHARAYPAIVDNAQLVKVKALGPQNEDKSARADRISDHMTWQLTEDMPSWEEETDRLLLMLPIIGCVFRKTWFDPVERRNVSEMVSAEDFVVNYWAKSLKDTPRYSQILRFYPHQVKERITAGLWRDIGTVLPSDDRRNESSDDDGLIVFIEQHCRIDLDDDGYPEPYVVTFHKDTGQVVRVSVCFEEEDVVLSDDGGKGAVVRIERSQYFSKYGFLPSPDGSFYDMGFGMLLEHPGAVINATINQLLDAGALANSQGGFIGSGVNIKGGALKMTMGKWNRVDVTGGTLRENLVPFQLPGPNPTLFELLGFMVDMAKGITSVQDVMTGGEDTQTAPVGTTLARIEQGMKVFSAIYKRIHRAFKTDLRMLFKLNRYHMDEQVYFNLNDVPGEIMAADYREDDLDVSPMSDPTAVTDLQKMSRIDFLMATFRGDPNVDQVELDRRAMEAAGTQDIEALLKPKGPDQDPAFLMAQADMANKRDETVASIRLKDAQAAAQLMAAAKAAAEMGVAMDAAFFSKQARELAGDSGEYGNEQTHGPGSVSDVEGAPADEGVSGISEPAPGEPDGGMGVGPIASAGGPDGGVPVPADGGVGL